MIRISGAGPWQVHNWASFSTAHSETEHRRPESLEPHEEEHRQRLVQSLYARRSQRTHRLFIFTHFIIFFLSFFSFLLIN